MVKLNVFVIHAAHLKVRIPICDNLKQKLKDSKYFTEVNFEYVTEYDPLPENLLELRNNVKLDKTNKSDFFDKLLMNLHVRKVSNSMKHYQALKNVVSRTEDNSVSLIIEDDVIYSDVVDKRLYDTIIELNKINEWDCNFLGFPQPIQENPDENVKISDVNSIYKVFPEVSSYLVSKKGARNLLDSFLPIHFQTNIQLSYLYDIHPNWKLTMSSPNIFVDGSKFGVYLSNVEANNKLFLNTDYTKLYKIIASIENTPIENVDKSLDSIFENVKFNNHPEFVSLRAQYLMKIGDYEKSKSLFDESYKTYMENDCILNGDSEFLVRYTRIFKYFQDN